MFIYLKLTGVIILSFILSFAGLFFNSLYNESFTTYALIIGLSVAGFIFGWILFLAYKTRKDLSYGDYIKIFGSLLGLAWLFGTGYILGSPESNLNATFGFFFLLATWTIIDPFWDLHYYTGAVKSKDIPIFSMVLNVCIIGLMVVSIVYFIDRISFANYGSIRPVKEASKEFRTLDELAASCKEKDKNLVLEIVGYKDGTAQARCEMQLFAETWDVTKLLKNIETTTFELELKEDDFLVKKDKDSVFAFEHDGCAYVFRATIVIVVTKAKEEYRISLQDGKRICSDLAKDNASPRKITVAGEDGDAHGILGERLKDGSVLLKKGRKLTIFDETAISTK